MQKSHFHILTAIIVFSLLVKLALLIHLTSEGFNPLWSWDTPSYHHPARALIEIAKFSQSPENPTTPETIRTPGYPLFLAGIYSLFGIDSVIVVVLQIFLSLITMLLLYYAACKLFNSAAGLIAVLILSLDLVTVSMNLYVYSETLFTLILTLLWICLILYLRSDKRGLWWLSAAGLLLALAVMIRPVAYYLIIPLIIAIIIGEITQHWGWKKITFSVLVLAIPFILIVGGWQYRNYSKTGDAEFSNITGINLYFYRAADVIALKEKRNYVEVKYKLGFLNDFDDYRKLHPETENWSLEQLCARWKKEGLQILRENPLITARLQLQGMIYFFLRPGGGHILRFMKAQELRHSLAEGVNPLKLWLSGSPGVFLGVIGGLIYLLILYGGIIAWLVKCLKTGGWKAGYTFLLIIILYFAAVSAGPEATARLRTPIIPILALFSASGWLNVLKSVRNVTG